MNFKCGLNAPKMKQQWKKADAYICYVGFIYIPNEDKKIYMMRALK